MKKNHSDHVAKEGNLVMFPASKNFPLSVEEDWDPLEDLLNEFSDITDEDLEEMGLLDRDDIAREEAELAPTTNLLQARDTSQMDENELFQLMGEQIALLEESHKRIRFYLNEIETFLPYRKK